MDDEFEATAAIASMASSFVAAAKARGKARAPRKAVGPPKEKKKELTPEERVVELAKAQYAALLARRGKEAVQDHGDGEKARPRGKTNSKKEDRRDAASIALLEKVEGMISKKDLGEEKRRQEKEEQMHAFMEIQKRRLEMDAERQAKMLKLEEAKQAKMLEIEAANARTKAKEVALASMKTGVEIMRVDLNTVSPRKRLWFEKM
ncbi:C2 domain-containing protein [Hordeum vulgare]|nr:C2 domain-containing protein [Hordeum vulgare]